MILNFTKVEAVDRESRFVLKRTNLGDRQILNRKHAVTNQIYSYERQRINEGKGVFPNALYQEELEMSHKTEFVIIKRCVNCGATNGPKENVCNGCSHLFIKEMAYIQWIKYCTELQTKSKPLFK